jgi:hypothetical protein
LFNAKWNEVYDFTEFVYQNHKITSKSYLKDSLNKALERENSAYRVLEDEIAPIIDDNQIAAIEDALESPLKSVKSHLQTALSLMADRDAPDFRNSVKESISAVEALCKKITKDEKADLSKCLKKLETAKAFHPAFKSALEKLYGYTSDEKGIRHSLIEESREITKADARFMLVTCSAFINYLIELYPIEG